MKYVDMKFLATAGAAIAVLGLTGLLTTVPSAAPLVPQGALAEYEGLESYEGPAKELGNLGSSGEPAE